MTNEKRLMEALRTSRDHYESTHDCKTDTYEQGYRDGMEHAEELIKDALSTPSPTSEGETPLCDEEFERVMSREDLGSTISYQAWLDCWEVLATQQATQGKVADEKRKELLRLRELATEPGLYEKRNRWDFYFGKDTIIALLDELLATPPGENKAATQAEVKLANSLNYLLEWATAAHASARNPNFNVIENLGRAIDFARKTLAEAVPPTTAGLQCHGRTGTPVGYLQEDNTVVFECDVCHRHVQSEITREEFLSASSPGEKWVVPEGFVVVPREPLDSMVPDYAHAGFAKQLYRDMLAAAPTQEPTEEQARKYEEVNGEAI